MLDKDRLEIINRKLNSINEWIKKFESDSSDAKEAIIELQSLQNENIDNIQHNYELIYELKDQIEDLKQEVNALKLIQIINIKQTQNVNKIKNPSH
ncbi:MAG: hypothetical protein AABY22_26810 [Nanoarchaeota archaeon]